MLQVVQISLKNKDPLKFKASVVSISQTLVPVVKYVNQENPIVLFNCQDSPSISLLDVSALNNYVALYFDKDGERFIYRGASSPFDENENNSLVQSHYKLVLFIPYPLDFNIMEIKSINIAYSNATLNWPNALDSNYHFKIPLESVKNYNLEVLNPLKIQTVSNEEFLKIDDLLPLFMETVHGINPSLNSLHFLAKEKCVKYATIQKSYLSGYYHGITIYEYGQNDSSPRIIDKKNETYI